MKTEEFNKIVSELENLNEYESEEYYTLVRYGDVIIILEKYLEISHNEDSTKSED